MARRLIPSESEPSSASPCCRLELYVVGDTLNARRALENLDHIVDRMTCPVDVTVIDVSKDPKSAFTRGVFATPLLIITQGNHETLVIGDLSDRERIFNG